MPVKPVSDYIQHLQDNASHTLQKVVLMSCYNHVKESVDCRQHLKDESQAPSAAYQLACRPSSAVLHWSCLRAFAAAAAVGLATWL